MSVEHKFKKDEPNKIPSKWQLREFKDCLAQDKGKVGKVKRIDYLEFGKYPIIDQGKQLIAGYTNKSSIVYDGKLPVIIFGDHTRIFKYINFPFVAGADGTKTIVSDSKLIYAKYFFYALLNTPIQSRGYNRHYSLLKRKKILLPPLVEQHGIAEVLSTVDEAIQWTDAVIEKAEELKRGLMQRLLTRGIGHTRFKKTELGEIPETWRIERGRNIFKIVGGYAPAQIILSNDKEANGLFIKVNDMNNELNQKEIITSENRFYIKENKNIKLFPKNTIIFAKRGAAIFQNRVRILSRDAIFDPNIMGLICKLNIDVTFLYFLLKNMKLYRLVENAGIPQLNNKQIYPLRFTIPPILEQKKIVHILSKTDELIQNQKKRKIQFIKLKMGLMQVLLTGKVRVRLDEGGLHRIRDG